MKAVLLSIQPKWVEKILNGDKTIEVRKTRPKIDTPFKCFVYKTKKRILRDITHKGEELWGTCGRIAEWTEIISCPDFDGGKVIGEFVCDAIEKLDIPNLSHYNEIKNAHELKQNTCIRIMDLHKYLGEKGGYAWHISDLKIYDQPRDLREFRGLCKYDDRDCCACPYYDYNKMDCAGRTITRPPQSWQYVEE